MLATADAMNTMKLQAKAKAKADAEAKAEALELAEKLKGCQVKIAAKGGEGGKLFGAVTGKEISEALAEQYGLDIDARSWCWTQPIKTFGSYEVKAKLGYEVSGTVYVLVMRGEVITARPSHSPGSGATALDAGGISPADGKDAAACLRRCPIRRRRSRRCWAPCSLTPTASRT